MSKKFKIVVLAKQVPDTRNVGKNAMKEDGTVNRAALPAIFNPEDMNALEQALRLKDRFPGSEVLLLTMGPGRAAEIIREGYYRGADGGILLTDRKFAGADTLATSYALSMAIKKISPDLIIAGRQAIDGDTAQVGPQMAEHLGIPQITYVEELEVLDGKVRAKRALEDGYFVIESEMPVLLTAIKELNEPRYPSIKGIYKSYRENNVSVWSANNYEVDRNNIGLDGSPTEVNKSFTPPGRGGESEMIEGAPRDVARKLIVRLKEEKVI